MTVLSPVAARVAPVNETEYVSRTWAAAVDITAGQVVYENTSGKAALARANATGTMQGLIGIAMNDAKAGQAVEVMQMGSLEGMGVSSATPGTPIFVDNTTAGALNDAAITGTGNFNVCAGRVVAMSDPALTRVLWVDVSLTAIYAALP